MCAYIRYLIRIAIVFGALEQVGETLLLACTADVASVWRARFTPPGTVYLDYSIPTKDRACAVLSTCRGIASCGIYEHEHTMCVSRI